MPEFGEKPPKRKKLEAGDIVYSPYKPPKRIPQGLRAVVIERHVDKDYPLRWRIERIESEPPTMSELPPHGAEEVDRPRGSNIGGVTPEQIEESRKKWFPNIEDSLPDGDRD